MDQSLSSLTCSVGKEGIQLLIVTLFRLRYHLLAKMRSLEIGSKGFWIPEVAKKAKENFLLAKQLFDSSGSAETEPISPKVIQIIDWLEELFEMKSKERDMSNRLSFFEEMFKKY